MAGGLYEKDACDGGGKGEAYEIKGNITAAEGKVNKLEVVEGEITATAVTGGGLKGETYILTPTVNGSSSVTWTVSGTCLDTPKIC